MKEIGWSFGMQSRAASRVGENPDIEGLADATFQAGIKEAIVFGKDHTGFCFYPTRIGVPHPRLKIDLTGEMTRALRTRGIRVLCYLNFGMDGETGRARHDWLHQSQPEDVLLTDDYYANVCPYSPYAEQLILPLIREILDLYDVDGFFLDTMDAFKVCYCDHCQSEYKKASGEEIPIDLDDPEWDLFGPYHQRRCETLMNHIRESVQERSPRATVMFNHIGGPFWPIETPGIISCDPAANYPWISLYANFLSTGAETGDVFIERFHRGWGDRCGMTDLTLEHKAASIFAHNQRFFVGDRLHPEVSFAPGSRRSMKFLTDLWRRMNRFMPPSDSPRVPDVIALYDDEKMFGAAMKFFGSSRFQRRWKPILGTQLLLTDTGQNVAHVPETRLEAWLAKEKLLILPETKYLSDATHALVSEFIADGGDALVVGMVPRLSDGSIPDWLGIDDVEDAAYQNCVYLPEWEPRDDEERTVVYGDIRRVRLGSAKPSLHGFSQYDLTPMGAGINSSSSDPDVHPLLSINAFGAGRAHYLNAPIFSDYMAGCDQQRAWFGKLLRKIHPDMTFSLDSNSGCVELVSYALKKKSWHVLVNHGGLKSFSGVSHEIVVAPQPIFPVTLRIRSERPLKSVKINGDETNFERDGNVNLIPTRMDSVWKIIETEKN